MPFPYLHISSSITLLHSLTPLLLAINCRFFLPYDLCHLCFFPFFLSITVDIQYYISFRCRHLYDLQSDS